MILALTNKSLGTQHFVAQRLTAIVNLLVGIPAFIIFLMIYDDGYSEIRELISQEIVWIPMVIYIISLSYHMKIGVGHMLDDYFDGGLKLFLGILNKLYVYLVALLSTVALIILGIF